MSMGRWTEGDIAAAAHLRMGKVLMDVCDMNQAHAGGCSLQEQDACLMAQCGMVWCMC
jgi:hypothetical protein